VHQLFQCLIAAICPLCVKELAEIFTIRFDADAAYNLVGDWQPENQEEAVLSIIIVFQKSVLQFLMVFGVSELLLFSLDDPLIKTLDFWCIIIQNCI
jgi:hypothetical protein